jgi:hypothetical protein
MSRFLDGIVERLPRFGAGGKGECALANEPPEQFHVGR